MTISQALDEIIAFFFSNQSPPHDPLTDDPNGELSTIKDRLSRLEDHIAALI